MTYYCARHGHGHARPLEGRERGDHVISKGISAIPCGGWGTGLCFAPDPPHGLDAISPTLLASYEYLLDFVPAYF